jgi:hypothetical protein
MGSLYKFQAQILGDGIISRDEVAVIQEYLEQNGSLDLADVKLLVELQSEAKSVCPQFDDLLFPALKQVLLADGKIGLDEQYYLLKTLCADGQVSERERAFIRELRESVRQPTPEFENFCEQVLGGTL